MIQLSYTAIADFILASPTVQRKTLRDYKYPDEDEPLAKRLYYREARDSIRAYHNGTKEPEWLQEQSDRLAQLADLNPKTPAKVRLKNNARTLLAYSRHYEGNQLSLSQPFKGTLSYGPVTIRVNPDLFAEEKAKHKIIRLDHSRDTPDPKYCTIVAQLMYEAALSSGLSLPASAFVVRHIESRTDYSPARKGARVLKDVMATCENIVGIWTML
jgi:hypothetical protein